MSFGTRPQRCSPPWNRNEVRLVANQPYGVREDRSTTAHARGGATLSSEPATQFSKPEASHPVAQRVLFATGRHPTKRGPLQACENDLNAVSAASQGKELVTLQGDPTTAAWGLFQVRFAFLVQELATAVFYLRRRREPKIQFGQIFKKSPDQLLAALAAELHYITNEGHTAPEIEEIGVLRHEIAKLKDWRDPRIHARVDFGQGIALYDWRTRKQLEMTAAECDKRSDLAIGVAVRLAGGVRSLLNYLQADESLVSEMKILLDPPDRLIRH